MSIKKIGVVGAGQMGGGIAHVSAQAGFDVVLQDLEDSFVEQGLATIDKNLQRGVDKGKLTAEQKRETLGRIRGTSRLPDLAECDFVVEAVVENLDVKLDLFRKLDRIATAGVILATNTSSISITKIAAATERAERVVGMHFMNPVPLMKLVEVIRGQETSDETIETVMACSESIGKVPVEANDYPGFVSNRVLMPMINEAVFCLMEGVAEKEAIDTVM